MDEADWPEREADQELIRRVNMLISSGTPAALKEARELMPAYVEASARVRAALHRDRAMISSLRNWAESRPSDKR